MPIKIRKVRNEPCFRVFNSETGEVYANCETKKEALEHKKELMDKENKKNEN